MQDSNPSPTPKPVPIFYVTPGALYPWSIWHTQKKRSLTSPRGLVLEEPQRWSNLVQILPPGRWSDFSQNHRANKCVPGEGLGKDKGGEIPAYISRHLSEVKSLPMKKHSHKKLISCVSAWRSWLNAPRAQVQRQQHGLLGQLGHQGRQQCTLFIVTSGRWCTVKGGVLGLLRTPVLDRHTWLRASLATLTPLLTWRLSTDSLKDTIPASAPYPFLWKRFLFQTPPGFPTVLRIKCTFLNWIY